MPTPRRMRSLLIALCALLATTALTQAAFETVANNGTFRLRAEDTPDAIGQSSFTILFYYRPSELPAVDEAAILEIPGCLRMRLTPDGIITTTLFAAPDPDGPTLGKSPPPIILKSNEPLVTNEFALIALSFQLNSKADVWVAQANRPISHTTANLGPFALAEPTSGINLGSNRYPGMSFVPAAEGLYGAFVVRSHAIKEVDIQMLSERRREYDLLDLENRFEFGGTFGSTNGALLMINHAILAEPESIGEIAQNESSSIVGYPPSVQSVSIFSAAAPNIGLNFAGPAQSTTGVRYRSTFEPEFDGYFIRTQTQYMLPPIKPTVSPIARRLARAEPDGLVRVIISANSRAVRRSEQLIQNNGATVGPPSLGSFLGGFNEVFRDTLAGSLFVPAVAGISSPYFGFDTTAHVPETNGTITSLRTPDNRVHDFSRLWTGSTFAAADGPGAGSYLSNGATFALLAKPEGRLTTDDPLVVQIHTLKFPGASSVVYSAIQSDQQSGGDRRLHLMPGVTSFETPLDTTRTTVTFTEKDSISSPARVLTLHNDYTNQIVPGDAITVTTPFDASISTVNSVTSDGASTQIILNTPMGDNIAPGVQLNFGPWEHITLEYEWPALEPGDHRDWRGLHALARNDGAGVALFSFSCYNPNANGYAFGAVGWAGNGYDTQLARSHKGVIESIAKTSNADIWFQAPAQQQSFPTSMTRFADALEAGLKPAAQIIWAADMSHGTRDGLSERPDEDWHEYILTEGPARGYPSLSLLNDPLIGDYKTQLIDGLRIDNAHITQRGNELLAERWMAQLREIARQPGDCDGDDAITFDDLICTLFEFGAAHGPADCDQSGTVDFNDLICTLFNFSSDP